MREEREIIVRMAGGLAGVALAATAWAQPPSSVPVPPTGPVPGVVCETRGPIRRAAGHTFHVLQDNLIGYPQEFAEPPVGFYNGEIFGLMRAKADPHRFTLYRSDFLDGTARLSPTGAGRFNLMAARLRGCLSPVLIEWSPEQPGLAESRRAAVLGMLRAGGLAVVPERVVIAPSPYPGTLGTDAANNYEVMIQRDRQAPSNYSVSPNSGGGFGGQGGGGR